MITLAIAWVLLVSAEGLGYAHLPVAKGLGRTVVIWLLAVLLTLSMLLRPGEGLTTWLLFCYLGIYRLINLARYWRARLPAGRLRSVCLRAHVWLVTMQAATLAVGTVVAHWHLHELAWDVVIGVQLLGSAVLVRATTHTWRHAAVLDSAEHVSNRELPAVSVLVPARDETDALEICLQKLTASDYPKMEIIALDGRSVSRRTPEIIRGFASRGVRFVKGKSPAGPDSPHWLARNFALDELAQAASGNILLFCTVDAQLEPDTIRRLVEAMMARNKDMISVLPQRHYASRDGNSMFQAMRYWWELCLPRRFFKRPPVLGTCWLIRRDMLIKYGGFKAASNSINPEAAFARMAVTTDSYAFVRSDETLGVYSGKKARDQYTTSVRVRYPQLHRRLELTAVVSLAEIVFLLGPILGFVLARSLPHPVALLLVWGVTCAGLFVTYGYAAVATRVANPGYGWLLMPVAVVLDIAVLHVSLYKYEFDEVDWRGYDVSVPVMARAQPASAVAN